MIYIKELDFFIKNKIDLENISEHKPKVYFLIKEQEVVYVGKSVNFLARILQHKKDKDFDSYYALPCENEKEMIYLEIMYIAKFCPKYNKTLPTSDKYFTIYNIKRTFGIGLLDIKRAIKNNSIKFKFELSGNFYYDLDDLRKVGLIND